MMILDYMEKHLRRELEKRQEEHEAYWRNHVPPTTATALAIKLQSLEDAQAPYKRMLVELCQLRDGPGVRIASKVYTFPKALRDPRIHLDSVVSEYELFSALADQTYKGLHTVEVSVFVRGLT